MWAALVNSVSHNSISLNSPTAGHKQQETQNLRFGKSEHKLNRGQQSGGGGGGKREKTALERSNPGGRGESRVFLKIELKKPERGDENSFQMYKSLM